MRSSLTVVLSLLVVAPCARAQTPAQPSQDACETVTTTTTTVRCSGNAAHLAVPPTQPAPAPTQIAPAPTQAAPAPTPTAPAPVEVLPPVPPPPDECTECAEPRPAPRAALPPLALPPMLSGGWHLELGRDGSAAYVRTAHTSRASVWAPGLGLWLTSYVASMAYGISRDGNYYTMIPIFGALGTGFSSGTYGDSPGATAAYVLGGLGQLAGMVTFIVGMAAGPAKLYKMPVQIGPMATKEGGGLSVSMKF